ncbi:MAG: DEAD/DEAH box helicase, partial [Pseudomonadota bacterium]
SGKVLVKAARQATGRIVELTEWQTAEWLALRGWPSFKEAMTRLHMPTETEDASPGGGPWQRLAYDELLAGQIALALVRQTTRAQRGRPVQATGQVQQRIVDALPFALTGSQVSALQEIRDDMAGSNRMLRLLQGDVGSGKTVVALMAMAMAVEIGAQAALMAPTEVLARQHLETIEPLAAKAGLRIGIITGRDKGKSRKAVLDALANGEIDILIGTHA